jgi:hypothetical protein
MKTSLPIHQSRSALAAAHAWIVASGSAAVLLVAMTGAGASALPAAASTPADRLQPEHEHAPVTLPEVEVHPPRNPQAGTCGDRRKQASRGRSAAACRTHVAASRKGDPSTPPPDRRGPERP